jgi:hypothetical protein
MLGDSLFPDVRQLMFLLWHKTVNSMLCYYANATNQVQILRIRNIPDWFYERVVFPRERLLMTTPTQAILEVYHGTPAGELLLAQVPCSHLEVNEGHPTHDSSSADQSNPLHHNGILGNSVHESKNNSVVDEGNSVSPVALNTSDTK